MQRGTARVVAALRERGAEPEVREFAESTRTAAEAAAALGCDVGAIVKSLNFVADTQPLLVLTSGAHQVDTDHVARQLDVSQVSRANADLVREVTGQPIGGVASLGHDRRLRTCIDVALAAYPTVWAAAGTPRSVLATTYHALLRLTDGQPLTVTPESKSPPRSRREPVPG